MKTYTEEQVARIAELRLMRYQLLAKPHPRGHCRKIKAVTGELWQLTQNPAYK